VGILGLNAIRRLWDAIRFWMAVQGAMVADQSHASLFWAEKLAVAPLND
jgi:hypothetical protein